MCVELKATVARPLTWFCSPLLSGGGGGLAGWTEGLRHLCPFSCPHNSLAVMKQGPTGIHTVSTYSKITDSGMKTGEGGRERLSISGRAVCKLFDLTLSLSLLCLNLSPSCTLTLAPLSLSLSLSAAVLPPGSVGEHGALDGLLRRLLSHLALHPHRARHAGPGKSSL